jgi:hypothetical protein
MIRCTGIWQSNQSSHLSVGTFGIPKKLLELISDVVHLHEVALLVGKSARISAEFRDYSDSEPFELQNFHRNFIFPIVKCVPANLEHIPASLESSPTIDSPNFMIRKTFLLYLSVASGIKFQDSMHQLFSRAPSPSHFS